MRPERDDTETRDAFNLLIQEDMMLPREDIIKVAKKCRDDSISAKAQL
jgi:hypothetical protein